MKVSLPPTKNVFAPVTKVVLIPLAVTATASTRNGAF